MINCLYVDDEPALLEIAKEFLGKNNDLRVITHEQPSDVVNILSNEKIDVIVSDYQMPGMNGVELYHQTKKAGFEIPFVLFTGRGREEVAIRALNAGIDFYLTKGGSPFAQFAELENVIRQLARRRGAEDALSYNNKKFQKIIENVLDIVIIVDHEGAIQYASPSVKRSLGYRTEEFVGSNAFLFLHQKDRYIQSELNPTNSAFSSNKLFEFRLRTKNGLFKWFEGTGKPMPKEFGEGLLVLSAWEIDDRKKMELEISNREKTLRAVFDNSSEFMSIISLDGTIRSANRKLCESTGYAKDELIGSQVFDLVAPSHLEHARKKLAEKVSKELQKTTYKMSIRSKDGKDVNLTITAQRINNQGEEPFIIVTGLEDRVLDDFYYEMLGTKEYIQLVIDRAQNLMIGLDRLGRVNVFNERAEEFTGIPASVVIGKDLRDLIRGDVRYSGPLADAIMGMDRYVKEGVIDDRSYLIKMADSTGELRKVLWKSNTLMKGDYYYGIVMSGMDVTDLE